MGGPLYPNILRECLNIFIGSVPLALEIVILLVSSLICTGQECKTDISLLCGKLSSIVTPTSNLVLLELLQAQGSKSHI